MEVLVIKEQDEFNKIKNGDQLVVVDFFAEWCGPCKMIAPKIAEFAKDFPDVKFCKVDVDELDEVAAAEGINAMPTFKLYRGGEKVAEMTGASADKLRQLILDHRDKK